MAESASSWCFFFVAIPFNPTLDRGKLLTCRFTFPTDSLIASNTADAPGVIVRSEGTKKGDAVITEDAYDQLRPLLQCVAMQVEHSPTKNGHAAEWSEEKNARRAALVNKKYDHALTAAEKKELAVLTAAVDESLSQADQVRNKILELVLAGLKQETSKKAKR